MSSPDQQAPDGPPQSAHQQVARRVVALAHGASPAIAITLVVLALVAGLLAHAGVFTAMGSPGSSAIRFYDLEDVS